MFFAEGVPPEIAGLPTWALNGLSIGGLVMLILMGLFTSRLWTKRQVDELTKQHDREVASLTSQHEREMKATIDRYELHLTRTVAAAEKRADDARTREDDWRGVAHKWQAVSEMLASGLEPLQDQGETMLRLLQAWQAEMQRRALGS